MSKSWLVGVSAVLALTVSPGLCPAKDISAKKVSINDAKPAKEQIAVQSNDAGVLLTDADDPATNGASIHVYSASDDFCAILAPGADWKKTTSAWKYANALTKNSAHVGDGKLSVKIKSGVTYPLSATMQGTVNVQVQFGIGTRYCMRCSGAKKDTPQKFLAKACAAAACDAEPSSCSSLGTTTSTTVTATTTTTACTSSPTGTVVKGSLTSTQGRFNYNLMVGLPGANSACNTNFSGSHACSIQDLQGAPATDLTCLKDTAGMTVTSFWAIDSSAPHLSQCFDDVTFNETTDPNHNWEYATAHTGSRGQWVSVNPATGALGSLQTMQQCNFGTGSTSNWVGCCQ